MHHSAGHLLLLRLTWAEGLQAAMLLGQEGGAQVSLSAAREEQIELGPLHITGRGQLRIAQLHSQHTFTLEERTGGETVGDRGGEEKRG